MSGTVTILTGFLFGSVVAGATALIRHLSRGTIPQVFEPLATRWVDAGLDPKWFTVFLWICFWLLASTFFVVIAFALYHGATGLGRHFN